MAEYKVREGLADRRKLPVSEWKVPHMVVEYRERFKKEYGYETRQTMGMMLCHINQRTVVKLFRTEGRTMTLHPNELYLEFMDWIFKHRREKCRISVMSNDTAMAEFLDERARKNLEKEIGTLADFKRQQEESKKRAEAYFEENKRAMMEEAAAKHKLESEAGQ